MTDTAPRPHPHLHVHADAPQTAHGWATLLGSGLPLRLAVVAVAVITMWSLVLWALT